jgi:TIR domain
LESVNVGSPIFISYRRSDVPELTARIFAHLSEHVGTDTLFLDTDSIEAGADFATEILQALQRCDVILVIIGPKWLKLTDESGRRRLDDPMDYV